MNRFAHVAAMLALIVASLATPVAAQSPTGAAGANRPAAENDPPTLVVSGIVSDQSGKPIAQATVDVWEGDVSTGHFNGASAQSDGSGRYSVSLSGWGNVYGLRFTAVGYETTWWDGAQGRDWQVSFGIYYDATISVSLPPGTYAISGTVFSDVFVDGDVPTLDLLNGSGKKLEDIWIDAVDDPKDPLPYTITVKNGTYLLRVRKERSTEFPLLTGYYSATAPGHWVQRLADATPIVVQNASQPNIDWTLVAAPYLSNPRPLFRVGSAISGNRLPMTVSWKVVSKGLGIGSFTLERAIGSGAWSAVKLSSPKAQSVRQTLTAGPTPYLYRAQMKDAKGNLSQKHRGGVKVALHQETSGISWKKTWSVVNSSEASGGSYRATKVAGATATITFTADRFAWVAPRGPGFGEAEVKVDGVTYKVNLNAAAAQSKRIVFEHHWDKRSRRHVQITNVGTAGHPRIAVDAFLTGTLWVSVAATSGR